MQIVRSYACPGTASKAVQQMLRAAVGPQEQAASGTASPLTAPLHLPEGLHLLGGVGAGLQCAAADQVRL